MRLEAGFGENENPQNECSLLDRGTANLCQRAFTSCRPRFSGVSSARRGFLGLCLFLLFAQDCLSEVRTLVILPFTNISKNPGIQWLSECVPEILEERMKWPSLNVLGREERVIAFDRIGIAYSLNSSKATWIKIGQELDAQFLILGEYSSDGKRIEVSLSSLDLRKSSLGQPLKESGPLEEIQLLSGRLAWKLLTQIDSSFPLSLETYLAQFPVIPNIALESYIRGLIESDQTKQIRFFRQAEREFPNYAKAILQLGKHYHQQKDYATSNLWLQKLFRSNEGYLEAHFLVGLNYFYLKNYDKSVEEFQRLSGIVPLGEVLSNLGIAQSLKGSNQSAIAALQRAVELEPSEPDYSFNLAYHYWRTGNFSAAVKTLDEVNEFLGSDGEAQYLLFKCFQALGKAEESTVAWEEAQRFNPKVASWEGRKQVPDLFRIQTHFDESSLKQLQLQIRQIKESKEGPRTEKEKIREEIEQAKQNLAAKQLDKAEPLLIRVIQDAPQSIEARLLMAKVLEAKGEKDRAISELRAALWLKESASARLQLSHLYLSVNRKEEAKTEALIALDLEPGNAEAKEILKNLASP
jgi:tetratricopeptide (TPR) repeat protein/TolB-like protein